MVDVSRIRAEVRAMVMVRMRQLQSSLRSPSHKAKERRQRRRTSLLSAKVHSAQARCRDGCSGARYAGHTANG